MKADLIARFTELDIEPTGKYEVTGYHDVDIAVGNFISDLIDGATVCEPNDVNKAFANFSDRAQGDKVIVGRFDDVESLLTHVRSADAGRESERGNPKINRDALPFINISRNFLVSLGNTDRAIQSTQDGYEFYDDNKNMTAVLTTVPATLTYDLWLIGPDKESTSILSNAIGVQLLELINTGFKARTRLAYRPIEVDCCLDGAKSFMLSDSSPTGEADRIYCATTQITVITEVVKAIEVAAKRLRVNLHSPQVMEEKL